jgi:crotonobetainyl-CoA:carnitine CoA-transferase CaiB-like acyl-CoA transferase
MGSSNGNPSQGNPSQGNPSQGNPSQGNPRRLLHGIRVLSLGSFVAGNICALMLSELGADVVKIEFPAHAEALRAYDAPDRPQVFEPSGIRTTAIFAGMTRGLRSVCVDMASERGRQAFRSLSEQAHVVVENLGPGTMESWGCSFDDLRSRNAALVMLSISGYGRTGPLAGFRAYASNINNFLGLTSVWALDGIHFDFVAGTHGACAVLAALRESERGAPGVFIDMAQTEAGAAILPGLYLDFLANGREWNAGPNEVPGSFFSGVIRCLGADAWVAVELEDASDWARLCSFLEHDELNLGADGATREKQVSLCEAMERWAATVTPLQATHTLQRIGLAAGPVQNGEDLWRDAQLRSRGAFVEVTHPDLGSIEYPDVPLCADPHAGTIAGGPRMGEHTAAVFREWLGCSEAEVNDLLARAAIWLPERATDLSPR